MGDLEEFPLCYFTKAEISQKIQNGQNRYESLFNAICRSAMKGFDLRDYFTELIFLYARAYHLKCQQTDDANEALFSGLLKLSHTHYGQQIAIQSTDDTGSSGSGNKASP